MEQTIYRFRDAGAFPVLAFPASCPQPVLGVEEHAGERLLRVRWERRPSETPDPLVLALPPRLLDGRIEKFVLHLNGDGSKARIVLAVADFVNHRFLWEFEPVSFVGRGRCITQDITPDAIEKSDKEPVMTEPVAPIQPFQLRILLGQATMDLNLGLHSLGVLGQVRLVAAGVAKGDSRRS